MENLATFILVFFPIFIAVDSFGILPLFISLTEGLSNKKRQRIVFQSMYTAIIVATVFLAIGRLILNLLNITVGDFMIAGGVLLFIISINNIMANTKKQRLIDIESLGAVPIASPLIIGPAVLTTSLILIEQHGLFLTALSLFINILIVGVVFYFSNFFIKIIGKTGGLVISKLASLLLAAIGVMLVRKGLLFVLKDFFM